MALKEVLDRGDTNNIPAAGREGRIGSHIWAGGCRPQREVLAVANNAAKPTYGIKAIVYAEVINGTAGNGVKSNQNKGAAVAANSAAPAADGKSINFTSGEVTGSGAQVEVIYWTTDPVKDADGVIATPWDQAAGGLL